MSNLAVLRSLLRLDNPMSVRAMKADAVEFLTKPFHGPQPHMILYMLGALGRRPPETA
jgi:FixJ family two-component response regulator